MIKLDQSRLEGNVSSFAQVFSRVRDEVGIIDFEENQLKSTTELATVSRTILDLTFLINEVNDQARDNIETSIAELEKADQALSKGKE